MMNRSNEPSRVCFETHFYRKRNLHSGAMVAIYNTHMQSCASFTHLNKHIENVTAQYLPLIEWSGSASTAATVSMQCQEVEIQSLVYESFEGHSVLQIYK